jgi:hypothetical protein
MPDDTRTARLARRYRRWLLAYPRTYRRERGPGILATLIDVTDRSRSRPAAREAAVLLRHGLGRRVAGFGRRAFVVAAFAAVLGGLSGIALGSWLAWRNVDPMPPDKTTAIGLAHAVLPGTFDERVDYYMQSTFWNPYSNHSLHGGTGVRAGRARVNKSHRVSRLRRDRPSEKCPTGSATDVRAPARATGELAQRLNRPIEFFKCT